jgi:hypothetical protein
VKPSVLSLLVGSNIAAVIALLHMDEPMWVAVGFFATAAALSLAGELLL